MSLTASPDAPVVRGDARVEVLFGELSELAGQRNAIDGRIVQIVAELDHDELLGATGVRSVGGVGGLEAGHVVGERQDDRHRGASVGRVPLLHPRHAGGSAVVGSGRGDHRRRGLGSDEHYAELASYATVSPLRTAVKLEPRPVEPEPEPDFGAEPDCEPDPGPQPSITKTSSDEQFSHYRLSLPHLEAAKFDAAVASHHEALVTQWKLDHDTGAEG